MQISSIRDAMKERRVSMSSGNSSHLATRSWSGCALIEKKHALTKLPTKAIRM